MADGFPQRSTTLSTSAVVSGHLAPFAPQPAPRPASPKPDAVAPLKPDQYAEAVWNYACLPTGAGKNYRALAEYLKSDRPDANSNNGYLAIAVNQDEDVELCDTSNDASVILYHLGGGRVRRGGAGQEQDSGDERSNDITLWQKRITSFIHPNQFYDFNLGSSEVEPRSQLVFLCGYMSARWLKCIGARHVVDPEFFARHLDFRNAGDVTNTFSLPTLPSTSWHLIQLPIMSIGVKDTGLGSMNVEYLEEARHQGRQKLSAHHKKICKLSKSGLHTGDTMIREFYVFDEAHFAIEQRVSICLTEAIDGIFSVFVWVDSGKEFNKESDNNDPWSLKSSEGHYLPTIKHKNMIALKSQKLMSQDMRANPKHALSASLIHRDYGRSLRPSVMATDALYALTEVFSFASSSEVAFLNMIEHKLDKYTESSEQEFDMLPNLKYVTMILYRHIQKLDQILDSISNTSNKKWPKAEKEEHVKKANGACKDLMQDFTHVRNRAQQIHTRCNEAITILMSSISIAESKRAIDQAERVMKLTFLAFIFVPLSFTTSFFGMNVRELGAATTSLWWWAVFAVPLFGLSFVSFFFDLRRPFIALWSSVKWIMDRV